MHSFHNTSRFDYHALKFNHHNNIFQALYCTLTHIALVEQKCAIYIYIYINVYTISMIPHLVKLA